jgi:hypothetical protein
MAFRKYTNFKELNDPAPPDTIDLSLLDGTNGFIMNGIDKADFSGYTVSGPGDINQDGFADILIGAWKAKVRRNNKNLGKAGEVYLVYGRSSPEAVLYLDSLDGANGFLVEGADKNHRLGLALSGVGDINGDGGSDYAMGAPFAKVQVGNSKRSKAGQTYVIFGAPSGLACAEPRPGPCSPDVNAPVINCPSDIIHSCGSILGYVPSATDDCGNVTITSVPEFGSPLPPGPTMVWMMATDEAGNSSGCGYLYVTHELPTADAGPDQAIIEGSSATLGGNPSASGGTGPYTYSWINVTGGSNPNAVSNPTVSPATTSTYMLISTDAYDCAGTDLAMVTVNSLRLSNERSLEIDIHPNPADDFIFINYDLALENQAELTVFDMFGKKTLQQTLSGSQGIVRLITETWAAGHYLIKINNGVEMTIKKIVVR